MEDKLNSWINANSWVKESELYESGEYKKWKPETVRKIDLNNLNIKKLIKFLDFWKLYEPYPNEIYLYIDALSEEDKESIKDNHLQELIELGINVFSIEKNNLVLLQYLIENNFITNDKAYINATINGHLDVVRYLVDHGANIHAKDDNSLRWASENGHLDVVKYLVEHGANVNGLDDQALRWASNNGKIEIVKYLVDHGANVHALYDYALRLASQNGHLDVVKYLVNHGANIHTLDDHALIWASANGHLDIVAFLKEHSKLTD